METPPTELLIPDSRIIDNIYLIRGEDVMVDRDLALLYQVDTKVLKQAVKRNIENFPTDFMFEMTDEELANWRSQIVTSNSDKMGLRHKPFCFTESGISMLASVLKSKRAIQVNIHIIRVFVRMRKFLSDNLELRLELEKIKQKLKNNSENIEVVFRYLDELTEKKPKPRKQIGYKLTN